MKFLVLAILLGMVASARADEWIYKPAAAGSPITGASSPTIVDVIVTSTPTCTGGLIPNGATITVTYVGATPGYSYAILCQGNCPNFADVEATFKGNALSFTYTLTPPSPYTFTLYGNTGAAANLNRAPIDTTTVATVACQGNDPILTGFDGRTFHFDELGEYVILESGDGYKVHSTFAGATAANSELEVMERSWTSSVRLFSPNGDMVSCALPAIVPNTTRLQVTAASVAETTMLSSDKQSVELSEMSATVVLSEGDGPKYVTGCLLSTPKLDIRVDQVSGYEQAMKFPDTEAWAAPFTWLNAAFTVKKPLASPVTGILGATYPADKVAEQYALTGEGEASKTSASMDGEQPGPKTHRRALLNGARNVPFSAVTSGIVGLAPVSRAA